MRSATMMTAAVVGILWACQAPAQDAAKGTDWAQFLGPNRDGTSPEKGLLREWPDGGPKLLWKVPVAAGYGTPTVSKGSVFLLGRGDRWGKADKGRSVVCLDAVTGKPVWEFKYETQKEDKEAAKKMEPAWGWCPRATVTATDDAVYSIDEIGEIYRLDRETGKPVWSRDLDTDYKPAHSDWKGWCASPVVVDGKVILPISSLMTPPPKHERKIAALDAKTGKTLWEFGDQLEYKGTLSAGGGLFVTPQLTDFAGEACVLWPGIDRLYAVRVADGKKVWECPGKGRETWQITPQVWGAEIMMARLVSVDRTKPPFETKALWEPARTQAATTYAVPVRWGDYAYVFYYMNDRCVGERGALHAARLSCIEIKTGREVWTKESLDHGASAMVADGLIFARWKDGVHLLEATPDGFKETGKVEFTNVKNVGNSGWVMPVLSHGRLYVRTEDTLYCYQAAKEGPEAPAPAGNDAAPR